MNDVVNVLRSNRDANEVLGDTAVDSLLLVELFVSRGPRVNGKRLRVANTIKKKKSSLVGSP